MLYIYEVTVGQQEIGRAASFKEAAGMFVIGCGRHSAGSVSSIHHTSWVRGYPVDEDHVLSALTCQSALKPDLCAGEYLFEDVRSIAQNNAWMKGEIWVASTILVVLHVIDRSFVVTFDNSIKEAPSIKATNARIGELEICRGGQVIAKCCVTNPGTQVGNYAFVGLSDARKRKNGGPSKPNILYADEFTNGACVYIHKPTGSTLTKEGYWGVAAM